MAKIPIVSITGTNGKTTTSRMLASILERHGFKVGLTTTHGIFINGRCIRKGDSAGPNCALRVLDDPEVEFAVLETARGGILRKGLAYGLADVAVFTNLTEDHLGTGGVNTLDDLWKIKVKVVEGVKEDGTCVLNADDSWVLKSLDRARGKVLLYSMEPSNLYVQNWINKGKSVITVIGNDIVSYNKGKQESVISICDIPATLNGALKHNIYNSMAAIGAAYASEVPFETIRCALSDFKTTQEGNPGRFNMYELKTFKVVLDFGHNYDGCKVTLEGIKNLNPLRLIGIVGLPGNRRDIDMYKIGKLAGSYLDRMIIREDIKLRGRQPYEAGSLIRSGALAAGMSEDNVEIIPDERKGLLKLLSEARDGDIIIVFYDKIKPLIKLVELYKNILQ
ncbi:MAG: MurE3 [Clostridiales bacterium]|nr:MurE3 [Clostridiales bacterium]